MVKISVVYHSGYGHTEVIAKAVARGAGGSVIKAEEIDNNWNSLHESDAIIFGAPTYMGSLSAPFKLFMDKTSKTWMEQKWKNKIAAGFTNSGGLSGDKLNSLVQLAVFAAQHGMIWVGNDVMSVKDGLNRISSYLGIMSQSDNVPPDQSPPKEDIETAEIFGKRVKEVTEKWVKGNK